MKNKAIKFRRGIERERERRKEWERVVKIWFVSCNRGNWHFIFKIPFSTKVIDGMFNSLLLPFDHLDFYTLSLFLLRPCLNAYTIVLYLFLPICFQFYFASLS